MRGKLVLFLVFSAFVLSMCRQYDSGTHTSTNGLSCQSYTDYRFFEWRGEEYDFYIHENGATCSYMCPDGTVRDSDITGDLTSSSPLYSASKADLDARFCGVAEALPATPTQVTPTQAPPSETPTSAPSPTLAASPTSGPSPTAWAFPTVERTPALEAQSPLLTGKVTMCDIGTDRLISFRTVQPPPDLTAKTLMVRIAEQETTCTVNPTNPSLLTCAIPAGVTFPAAVVVSLDDAVVNDFIYDGLGCAKLSTPIVTTAP